MNISELKIRWHVFRCRRKSDTSTRYLMELARCVASCPVQEDPAPILEVGTRSGGSALLILKMLKSIYPKGKTLPYVLTIDPYGMRPYEGEPFIYDERHYGQAKRNLVSYTNHIHYMMDSELFLKLIDQLYIWDKAQRAKIDRFTLVYLDGSHDPDIVWSEMTQLLPMIIPGGYLIIDDTDWFEGELQKRLDNSSGNIPGKIRHNGKQSIIQKL
ncbi:MAG: class I SAM-dependent methyltransferase [Cyclobacteriaceae bacterium]